VAGVEVGDVGWDGEGGGEVVVVRIIRHPEALDGNETCILRHLPQ
jgi:hypothetical protein